MIRWPLVAFAPSGPKLTLLLDHEPIVGGSHVAHIHLRPFRLAYIVPNDVSVVSRVIASCSLQWGGFDHQIIPASADGHVEDHWLEMLRSADPDMLVDASGLSEPTRADLKREGWSVHDWDTSESNLYVNGSLIYAGVKASLRRRGDETFPPSYWLAEPRIEAGHDLYLPTIARYGLLDEDAADEVRHFHGWAEGVRIEQFIRTIPIAVDDNLGLVAGVHISAPIDQLGSGVFHTVTLPRLANTCLFDTARPYSLAADVIDRRRYDRGFSKRIIVTGEKNSIEDLSLYWNIRASRPQSDPFPIWIPLDYLETDDGRSVLQNALMIMQSMWTELIPSHRQTYIVSASVDASDLENLLTPLIPDASFMSSDLESFISSGSPRVARIEDREVHLSTTAASMSIPKPQFVDIFGHRDRVVVDADIESFRLPGRSQLSDYRPIGKYSATMAVTRSGSLADFHDCGRWPTLELLAIPSGWGVLEQYFAKRGYRIMISDKARAAIGLLSMLSAGQGRDIMNSSVIYDLLRNMSKNAHTADRVQDRMFATGRLTRSASEIVKAICADGNIGQTEAHTITQHMISSGLLLRGTMLTCPTCQLKLWYALDRLAGDWTCDGCRQIAEVPLNAVNTQWSYRINELCAHGFDQGTISVINALMALEWERDWIGSSLLGYVPGIIVKGDAENRDSEDGRDIDVAAFVNGRLTIVECKEEGSGRRVATDDVRKLVQLGMDVGASRVVFAAADAFPEDVKSEGGAYGLTVEFWERDDLLDSLGRNPYRARSENDTASRATDHLRSILRRTIPYASL